MILQRRRSVGHRPTMKRHIDIYRPTLRVVCGLLFIAFAAGAPAFASFDDALAAYKRGNYEIALEKWLSLAVKGHTQAQFNLAKMYDHGHGVTQNHAEAVRWYRNAALRGDAESQVELAQHFFLGRGVNRDLREAVEWSKIAAKAGHPRAQYLLGVMYVSGQGAPQNYVQAYLWFSLAAAQGDEKAETTLEAVVKRMSPIDLFRARQLVQEKKPKK
jgi:TPR repeat protein